VSRGDRCGGSGRRPARRMRAVPRIARARGIPCTRARWSPSCRTRTRRTRAAASRTSHPRKDDGRRRSAFPRTSDGRPWR
jgi:hypothetical protein